MEALKELYRVEQLPIFQNRMYDTEREARNCPKGDVRLVEDLETGLIYNAAFQAEWMVYDRYYQNEQAVSPLFQTHLDAVAEIIGKQMGREKLVEVGCGKENFLETLLGKEFDVTGFDPTYEGTNSRVKRALFSPGLIENASGLILRHVLEHIQNPIEFLKQLKIANGHSGQIYIEVPCFDWICQRKAWFDIFYEHVNYFRIDDFRRIFGTVHQSGKLFGGQYLYVIADLSTLRNPVTNSNDRVNFPPDFAVNITQRNETEKNRAVVWGGASKGVIFALLRARAGQPIRTVIDINPEKQGKFLPGTGLKVKTPEEGLMNLESDAIIYVMNSNYLEEIKQMSHHRFKYIGVDHE